jgi:hypothetical protein
MAIILALPKLFDDVVARFAAEGTVVPNLFGWRTPPQKLVTSSRICWVPGDDSGALGELLPARHPGGNPRSLATLGELFTVWIVTSDPDAAKRENERAQYQSARELFDAWWRAVYLAAHGTVRVESASWVPEKKERRFGAAILVVGVIEAMVPDEEHDSAPVDTKAVIDVTELNVTEVEEITP